MMGDGVIDLKALRESVEAQGYAGYSEVEIFSAANWWQRDGGEVLDTCIERHKAWVLPRLITRAQRRKQKKRRRRLQIQRRPRVRRAPKSRSRAAR
jgi:hypothetical protein